MALLTTVNMPSINQESSTITKDLSTATINGIDLETVEQEILLKDRAETIATAAKVTFSQDVLLPNNEITIQGNIIDKNIIDAPKMRNNFCCTKLSYPLILLSSMLNFCMDFVHWFMASFLYCTPYNYQSCNDCIAIVVPLSCSYRRQYKADISGRVITIEREIDNLSKEMIPKN